MQNQEQILASDPAHSVWVSASAGTGKTKVLTDRVLRLLLEDVAFDKILCLTFTNAAATEMTNRISAACFDWRSNTDSLKDILGRDPTREEIIRARSLFSRLILSPRQLSIHTIHSFCQKILQSFPFEAGLQPGFKVIGEIESDEMIDRVAKDLAGANMESITYLLQNLHENTFLELVREIISDQIYFHELFQQFPTFEEYGGFLRSEMDVEECKIIESSSLNLLANPAISAIFHKIPEFANKFTDDDHLISFFLTAKGEPKKKLITKKESDAFPGIEQKLREIQEITYQTCQKLKRLRMISATIHIYKVAKVAIEKYNFYKKHKGYLDYDDLIYHTKELLTNGDMKDWVLYKLDGGVMHLLIDEAQDTSPEQWQIIEAIMSEFYSGSTSVDENRTIFIVGDDKQSIYSFQGADVSNFNRFNDYIRKQMIDSSKSYKDVELKWSYRSGSAILDFVAKVWSMNGNEYVALKPFRNVIGTVELWPLYNDSKEKAELFWPLIDEMKTDEDSVKLLACDIAKYIGNYIASGRVLPSTGKPAKAEDFMILVRRRGEFMGEVVKALKDEGVDVGGMDRMVLTDHISVQDILSLAKYALMPLDDLNIAELLKSPIVGMSDDELRKFCIDEKLLQGSKSPGVMIHEIHEICLAASKMTAHTVFDFFYYFIEIVGLREILVSSNGPSTHDALDELLNLVMQFEKSHSSSLQEFIYWIERKDMEVKRDPLASGVVRVMTIHGSKGLQAPVVILADTTSLPSNQNHLLWSDGICLWLGGSENSNEQYKHIKKSVEDGDYHEYLRLLYVALTRAEDHLIIAGSSSRETISEGCFYDVVNRVMMSIGCNDDGSKKWVGDEVVIGVEVSEPRRSASGSRPRDHINGLTYKIPEICMHYVSRMSEDNIHPSSQPQSPLHSRTSLNYGQLIHKILEDSVNTNNFAFSPSHPMIRSLPKNMQTVIVEKLGSLFMMEEFVDLIKNSKISTEVSIGYNDGGMPKIGRIDLLAMRDQEIIIVDYKTDKNVPKSISEIPENYMKQLKFYADAISKIYPEYKVDTKILWIEELIMM